MRSKITLVSPLIAAGLVLIPTYAVANGGNGGEKGHPNWCTPHTQPPLLFGSKTESKDKNKWKDKCKTPTPTPTTETPTPTPTTETPTPTPTTDTPTPTPTETDTPTPTPTTETPVTTPPDDEPSLPHTGSSAPLLLTGAGAMLLVGTAGIVAARRRRDDLQA